MDDKKQAGKCLLKHMQENGLDDYGSYIDGDELHAVLGIEMPETATKKVFDQLALVELSAVDYVRNVLLGEGKYITKSGNGYRILLPSETEHQVDAYIRQAKKKLSRAQKLRANFDEKKSYTNKSARIMMHAQSV